jgi:hypothetical protein
VPLLRGKWFATQSRAGSFEDVQAIRIRLATVIESPN